MWRPVTRSLLVISCGFCLFAASGCSLFSSNVQDILVAQPPRHLPEIPESSFNVPAVDPWAQAEERTKGGSNSPSCYIEIRAVGKDPKRIRMSLDDATTVQAVLERTGLVKRFKNMEIELTRKGTDGTPHKLEIHYDTKRNRVVSLFDYALHSNDLLVIKQDSSTSFDEMLKKLTGPLAR
jgi:hypothetical protein